MSTRLSFHCRRAAAIPVQGTPETVSLLDPVDARISQLEKAFRYVHVTIDPHFIPADCDWCDGQETTSVRIYGDPIHDEHVQAPIDTEEVGMRCALKKRGPIWQAGYESRTDKDIKVEVCA